MSLINNSKLFINSTNFSTLLAELGWPNSAEWLDYWLDRGGESIAANSWPDGVRSDWFWSVGFPFLSDLERHLKSDSKPVLFGISGLPGCGKTTFGRWLEAAALELNISLAVISLDDFYLPSPQLDLAMAGNPWNVPRALPGSHSTELIMQTIQRWKRDGNFVAPVFDKALRNGKGDRSGWRECSPQILIIEGWFLGCPLSKLEPDSNEDLELLSPPLSLSEKKYRSTVQKCLEEYIQIWEEFDRLWHFKADDFRSTKYWKAQQESNLIRERGSGLSGDSLDSFIRMIEASLPQTSLECIASNVLILLNQSRSIKWVGRSQDK